MSVSLYNHPISHSEPKYTMSPESCSNLFQEAGNLGSFGNNMILEVQSFHCLLSLFHSACGLVWLIWISLQPRGVGVACRPVFFFRMRTNLRFEIDYAHYAPQCKHNSKLIFSLVKFMLRSLKYQCQCKGNQSIIILTTVLTL